MPDTSRVFKTEGGAPTFPVEAIRIGSLVGAVAPARLVSECDFKGGSLKVLGRWCCGVLMGACWCCGGT
jgi:hypothetical protein